MSISVWRWPVGVCILTALVLAVSHAQAGIFEASRDTTIFQNNPDNSLGGGVTIYAGRNSGGSRRRALLAFGLSDIPVGSTIHSVELDLVLASVSGGGSGGGGDSVARAIGLHKLLGDWSEGTSGPSTPSADGTGQGYAAITGEHPATWTSQFHNTDPWTSAGGDFASTPSASTSVGNVLNTTYTWGSPAMVSDVQGWVNNPSSNFGWLLMGDENVSGTFRTFWSREADLLDAAHAVYEPKLIIDYTAVPEPSSLIMFSGGAVAVLVVIRRGRRRS